ncbi:MAG: peptidoglycan DD-metalloendopeptidase family protein [Chitinispirillia bacterium]|nr:peptidoglycan DD-metalloendopeptidase family protein [Chitinispirillia bacterium]MCL2242090.1 peptidoglycan DD-metalloendopeptidase family protein [Chitinispirillia bacterium]
MARKLARGTKIFGVARAAALAAAAFTAVFALPLHAQQKGKAAESAVSVVEREIRQTQAALDSIRAVLDEGRAAVKKLQSEEGNYLSRLEQIERNITVSGRYMTMVQRQIDTTGKTIALLADSLAVAEGSLESSRELMKKRLRSLYMTGTNSEMQMLLSAGNPTEFIHRARFFQDLNSYDKELAETIRRNIAVVNEKRSAQEEGKAKLEKLLSDKQREQLVLVDEELQRRTLLEEVRTKRGASEAMVAELEEAHRGLNELIKLLETRRKRAKEEDERQALINFEKRKGKLGWPLRGEVIGKFGRVVHPVYKTVTTNDGIDIAANKGTPVKSVAPGTAVVSSMRGLGRFVLLDHGGGYYTIYAHLDEIGVKQDQKVKVGEELGKSGGTYSGPKLNFKIKKMVESLNPEEWLEK